MNIIPQRKTCKKCGQFLPNAYFYRDKSHKDGLSSRCIACKKKAGKGAYQRKKHGLIRVRATNHLAQNGYKLCGCCGQTKPLSEYYKDNDKADKVHGRCKICDKKNTRTNQQTVKNYNRKQWARLKWHAAKTRAKKRGLTFDLTIADVQTSMPSNYTCPVLGTPFTFGGTKDTSPALDRLIAKNGYTKNNITIISDKANRIKQNATSDEVLAVANWMKSQGL